MNRAPVLLAALLTIALTAACQGRPDGSGCVRSDAPVASPGSGCAPLETPRDSAPPPDDNGPADIDATLLAYLPESVGDVPLEENVGEAATAVSDPTLSRLASAIDVGVALDESTGDLVTAHVVRLRQGAFDDSVFRQWRDTFDAGACAAAGGVDARAEMTLDDRRIFVTSCVAELRTYHVWIEEDGILISVASIGAGRFGELVMNGLRIP